MVRDRRRVLVAGSLLVAAAACDTLHPPVVHNGLEGPIEIRASWSDGTESSGSIAPNQVAHLGRAEARLRAVVVLRNGTVLVELQESGLSVLRGDPGVVGVSVDDDGIHELTRDQLTHLRPAE